MVNDLVSSGAVSSVTMLDISMPEEKAARMTRVSRTADIRRSMVGCAEVSDIAPEPQPAAMFSSGSNCLPKP